MIYASTLSLGAFALLFNSANAKSWSMTDAPKVTSYGGVASTSDSNVYAAATDNTNGPVVEHSTDGFATFEGLGPFGLINTGVAFHGEADVGLLVYGGGGLATFDNAGTFTHDEGITGFTQDAQSFGESSFGSAGAFVKIVEGKLPESVNGVAVSTDLGKEWNLYDIDQLSPRYSAYPSDDVWYVSGGSWPAYYANTNATATEYRMSEKITLHSTGMKYQTDATKSVNGAGYVGYVQKTTDGGATWSEVFHTSSFYMNQIDCFSEEICMAVGEGNGKTYVLRTTDGGANWKTVHTTNDGSTAMAVNMLSESEAWVSGGNMVDRSLVGYFWHTVDSGITWDLETLESAISMDMCWAGANNVGYSTGTNEFEASIVVYN